MIHLFINIEKKNQSHDQQGPVSLEEETSR